ncbi:unnamed protein product [Oppiella nova]|uniref:Uncharacterized protein n=1 Tax=Oppiella nova TaxID=334625 RepID=A0A7R9QMR3_9ACAR|nr:unnamed protein product [Oppiella nova]CAG2168390.1 unnamed protein product [Oppiella nova]
MNALIVLIVLSVSYECFGYVLRTGDDRENRIINLKDINTKLHETQVMLMMKKLRPKRDAMDNLIYEVVADAEKDELESDYDKSNFKAESIRHRLNERIEHIDLVLTHLKDIKKHFDSVHKMAKTLVESDATADFVKKFAIDQLNDSVQNVEKCDQCWS